MLCPFLDILVIDDETAFVTSLNDNALPGTEIRQGARFV